VDETRVRHGVLMVSGVVLALVVLALVGFAVLWPEAAQRAGRSPTEGMAPETPMDWLSLPPYAAALVLCAGMLVRGRGRAERRPLWVLLTFVLAWLLWRELPFDERILNDANTFSWAKYLGRTDVPVWAQVVLGGGSILVTVLLVVYVVRRARSVGRLLAEKVRSLSGWVFAAGVGLLALSQAFDKYNTFDKHLGTDLAAWKASGWLGYAEESLELLGPMVLLVGCLLAMLEEPAWASARRGQGASGSEAAHGPVGGGGPSSSSVS